jgi:type IV pilus assembly protein PilC
MAKQYEYKARDASGQLYAGLILAEDEAGVAGHIRSKGLYVTQIKLAKSTQDIGMILQNWRKITTRDLSIFCRQFATMLEAGMPILSCLGVLAEQTENPRLKDNLQKIYKNVQEGMALARAMEVQKGVFPDIMTSMVEAGELGGMLDDVMQRLSIHFEKEHRLNEKVKAAMTYPVVVMAMAVLVVIFVLTFILPTFVGMFASMKVELPLLTRGLLAVSGFLTNHWLALLLLAVAASLGINWGVQQPAGKELRDRVILKLPVFGLLVKKVAVARCTRTLASLLRGGVPLLSALEVVKNSAGNVVISKALSASQDSIKEGEDLSTRLGASKIFPPMVVQMVSVGEEAGELDRMLDKVADFYEEDAQDMVNRLSSLLEPFLIGFLGITIGAIVIAIMLPMFDVIGNMNKIM